MSEANGPDKSLLRWQEDGELYEAEERILKAFREGWKTGEGLVVEDGRMIFAVPPEGSSAPEKPAEGHTADDWQGAILRAEFLRDLFLGNYGKFDPRLIEISRAWIEGRLDLDYCESHLPLAFSRCIFSDGISLWDATIPELRLPGCEVRKSLGRIRSLSAPGVKVSSNVFLNDGFKADGEVYLYGADIGGELHCRGHFEKGLNAESLKTSSAVFMDSRLVEGQVLAFESNGEVILRSAEIGGQLICSGGRFKEGLNAGGLKTSSGVFMNSIQGDDGQVLAFESNGEVNLHGAEIGGQLICSGGRFKEGLNAGGLKTSSAVFMDLCQVGGRVLAFKSNGVVNLTDAKISGNLYCHGLFKEGLNAGGLKTSSGVFMSSLLVDGHVFAFKSNGVVSLFGAEIGGRLICRGGRFKEGLNAVNLKTSSDVFMDSEVVADGHVLAFESDGEVNLFGAEIGGFLCLGGATIRSVRLASAEVRGALVDLQKWPRRGTADGFIYQTIAPARGWKTGWKWVRDMSQSSESRLSPKFFEKLTSVFRYMDTVIHRIRMAANGRSGWVGLALSLIYLAFSLIRLAFTLAASLMAILFRAIEELLRMLWSSEFSPQPYEQLMSVYRRMGHTNWARNVGFQLEKRRGKAFKGWHSLTWRPWYIILRWTIGYGYKPFRFFLWAAGLMTAGFLLFSSGHPDGIVSRYAPQSWQVVSKFAPLSWQEPAFLNKVSAFFSNEWIPSDGEALASESWKQDRKPPLDYLPFNPLVYSLEATFPVLNLGQLEKWHPSNRFLLGARWACTLIGTLLLAILALFGAGVLGPRWRSGDEGG